MTHYFDVRVAIDPGDVHVGWAQRAQGIVTTGEWTPNDTIRELRALIAWCADEEYLLEIVMEEWRLYPGKAPEQGGKDMKTSQLIGAIKLVAHDSGVPVTMQGASIKKPTRAQLRARGIQRVARGSHASDAELHLWYRILRERESQ